MNEDKPGAEEKKPMFAIRYDKPNVIEAKDVTITFDLEKMAGHSFGVALAIGLMEQIKDDISIIISRKQQAAQKLASPAGPIQVVP